jgi:hypothetical protein
MRAAAMLTNQPELSCMPGGFLKSGAPRRCGWEGNVDLAEMVRREEGSVGALDPNRKRTRVIEDRQIAGGSPEDDDSRLR